MSISTISADGLGRLMTDGQTVQLIDVRTPAEFAGEHVAGAVSIPLDKLDPAELSSRRINSGGPIYVMCETGARSAMACRRLAAAGIDSVTNVEGGIVAWRRAGLSTNVGRKKVMPMERQVRLGAGLILLIGLVLAWTIHPYFLAIPAFVAVGLIVSGVTGFCGMAIVLGKMPWNTRGENAPAGCDAGAA